MTIRCPTVPLILVLLCVALSVCPLKATETINVSFINVSDEPIELLPTTNKGSVKHLAPYKETFIPATLGDTFSYQYNGKEYTFTAEKENRVITIGPDTIKVECSTTAGPLQAVIKPYWSPRGAARFLELVYLGYYNGCALNRVVKAFLTQFGIAADFNLRTSFRKLAILDDIPAERIPFQPGYMSYAGSGPNSRTSEVFIVMSDASQHQLEAFGTNPWETPFGYVTNNMDTVDKWEASYGDMDPWGNGPDPQAIYRQDGYEYLKQNFPKLSYLEECNIVTEESSKEEEL